MIRNLARAALQAPQRRLLSNGARHPQSHPQTRFGPNGVVGAVVLGFVGGVYFYTVSQLKKQGDELMDELEELEKEIEGEKQ